MNNNDRLVRIRYALDIKDIDMIEVFELGGIQTTKAEIKKLLAKKQKSNGNELEDVSFNDQEYEQKCSNEQLEAFLNGLIIFKRGKREMKAGESEKSKFLITDDRHVNNVMLKKIKIALSLTSDDIIDILDETGVSLSNSELSAVLRREGQRNYKECGDRYARNFLKGLALRYRN